ncbi:hypothetical protein CON78_26090 [Bacillus toyonensis]|nr:hypothetical protein CON78_26090 [Bacillus toyonensis]
MLDSECTQPWVTLTISFSNKKIKFRINSMFFRKIQIYPFTCANQLVINGILKKVYLFSEKFNLKNREGVFILPNKEF